MLHPIMGCPHSRSIHRAWINEKVLLTSLIYRRSLSFTPYLQNQLSSIPQLPNLYVLGSCSFRRWFCPTWLWPHRIKVGPTYWLSLLPTSQAAHHTHGRVWHAAAGCECHRHRLHTRTTKDVIVPVRLLTGARLSRMLLKPPSVPNRRIRHCWAPSPRVWLPGLANSSSRTTRAIGRTQANRVELWCAAARPATLATTRFVENPATSTNIWHSPSRIWLPATPNFRHSKHTKGRREGRKV
jgi:hypothetical protein